VRVVDDDEACALAERGAHALPVVAEVRRLERDVDAPAAGQAHRRVIRVVRRVEDDGLGAGSDHSLDGRVDGLGATAGDRDLGFGVGITAAGRDDLGGDGRTQTHVAFHRRVLVVTRGH
jgi:hypothetical protein